MILSIVIPCRNEESHIEKCIRTIYDSVLDQNTQLEVLVIDGLSDDGTIEIINTLKTEFPSLLIIENKAQVTPVAFNLGIEHARGEFIQIIGARQLISKNYLQGAVDSLQDNAEIWCVGGIVENVYQTKESEIIGKAMDSSFGVGAGNFRIIKESGYTDTVGTPMYPAFVFDKIGVFDASLVRNQDDELNYRVTKAGGKIFINAAISIKYFVRAKLSHLYKQYYQYGYWKVYVNKKHKTITTMRQMVPLFFVLGLFGGVLLSLLIPFFWMAFLAGMAAYVLLALGNGFKAGNSFVQSLKISVVFPILHFSYGMGYLIGIIHFFVRNKKPTDKSKQLSRK